MASKGAGRLNTINKLFLSLSSTDPEFLDRLFSRTYFPFDLLKIKGPNIPTPLVKILLDFYDTREELFICNKIRFSITLEDILYITGLPIVGTLIANAPKKVGSFKDVFNLDVKGGKCSITSITSIALDKQLEDDVRIKAVLLILMICFVVPTGDGHRVKADYVRYVDDLNEVGGYAWGAALLAFLKHGIRKWKKPKNKSHVDGNLWIVLAFFLVRINGLEELIGIKVNHDSTVSTVPLILKCVEAVGKISQNHKLSYADVKVYLENLTEKDVRWTPYVDLLPQLPENLKSQEKYGLLLAPICFMNCLVYHKPHLTPKQFPRLKGVHLEKLTWKEAPLEFREISGGFAQNFLEIYKNELQDWCDRKLVIDFLPLSEGRDCASEDDEEEECVIGDDEENICFRQVYEKIKNLRIGKRNRQATTKKQFITPGLLEEEERIREEEETERREAEEAERREKEEKNKQEEERKRQQEEKRKGLFEEERKRKEEERKIQEATTEKHFITPGLLEEERIRKEDDTERREGKRKEGKRKRQEPENKYSLGYSRRKRQNDSKDEKEQPIPRKLIILDLNGLLVDVIHKNELRGLVKSDFDIKCYKVFRRPHCDEFLDFCFEKFDVGVWTSRTKENMDLLVPHIFKDKISKLKFQKNQNDCTGTDIRTHDNKPIFMKDLKKIWNHEFDESQTLLFDDSPHKAILNPPHTSVFPPSFRYYSINIDNSLGPDGELYKYLKGLAEAKNVPDYVRETPFGKAVITEQHEHWNHYSIVIQQQLNYS